MVFLCARESVPFDLPMRTSLLWVGWLGRERDFLSCWQWMRPKDGWLNWVCGRWETDEERRWGRTLSLSLYLHSWAFLCLSFCPVCISLSAHVPLPHTHPVDTLPSRSFLALLSSSATRKRSGEAARERERERHRWIDKDERRKRRQREREETCRSFITFKWILLPR